VDFIASMARPRGRFTILCDAGLSDINAELEQLAMDARRSPSGLSALIRRISARCPHRVAALQYDQLAQHSLPQVGPST
jgi:hypothetical protein